MQDILWKEFMPNNGFQHRAFARALASNHNDTRKLEGVALVNAEEHSSYLDEFLREMHESVLAAVKA